MGRIDLCTQSALPELHVVAQVVEAELVVVGAVGDIRRVGVAAFFIVEISVDDGIAFMPSAV